MPTQDHKVLLHNNMVYSMQHHGRSCCVTCHTEDERIYYCSGSTLYSILHKDAEKPQNTGRFQRYMRPKSNKKMAAESYTEVSQELQFFS
jgi:hypothetical protein